MSSSMQRKRIRKPPSDRRAEIVDAAAAIALAEGLECITLRRVAEQLGVRPGLISHCFPVVEDLVAEAFGTAAGAELNALLPTDRAAGTPTDHLARFFALATGAAYDDISRLWINARHLSRYRPVLRDRVGHQEALWRGRLEALVRDGTDCGEFHTAEPYVTTIQIMVVIDGLGAHANTETGDRPEVVTRMAVSTAERELVLAGSTLTRHGAALDIGRTDARAASGSDGSSAGSGA
ncbi:TetR/AcrR family transcriptional regulator [Streptomyces sp. NBC_01363]|uniref:TetR/AcrR family transcriptional regulator n=1 Tax=Streptomyces sp. NBC_01363 TaxID=2903840 RepID=UPI002251F4D8|nr:TetR/AcrR family transcriptional regulator [Streptomyces sp. NBC_01363]MCX4733473.1 TetR family transcriptional regulator C-terminal domain-containing protein [Streptomyces sp. NBC_01363]